jgi:single-strand DNA-binding protein
LRFGFGHSRNEWLERTAARIDEMGFDLSVAGTEETFDSGARFDAPALYFGWYAPHVEGPFLREGFRFPPGAIAFHIHSFSASTLRAPNRRWTGRDGQQQEETTYLNVNCWRALAENSAESLTKGDRVIVIGRLRVRSYENQQGQTVWVTEIEADEIAPSLRWAQAKVAKTSGSSADKSGDAIPPPPSDDDVPF